MELLHYFVGVKIVQNPAKWFVWIGQPTYATCTTLLKRFRMENAKSVKTSVCCGSKLVKAGENDELAVRASFRHGKMNFCVQLAGNCQQWIRIGIWKIMISTRSPDNTHKKCKTVNNNNRWMIPIWYMSFQFKSILIQATKRLIDQIHLTAIINVRPVGVWIITRQKTTAK